MNADLARRLENLIRFGRIKTIEPSQPYTTVTVNLGEITTGNIRYLNLRAGADRTWDPPSIGEEVVVLSPSGVLDMGVAIAGLNNETNPAPSSDLNKVIRLFSDGCILSYDTKTHHLDAVLPEGGTCNLTADVSITGKLTVSETITAGKDISTKADVKAGDISLRKHRTPGIQSGGSTSGAPVP